MQTIRTRSRGEIMRLGGRGAGTSLSGWFGVLADRARPGAGEAVESCIRCG